MKPFRHSEQGIALVITLLVLTLLITLILEFQNSMRVEARAAANFRDDLKAYYLARAGITFARAVLEDDAQEDAKKPANTATDDLTEPWAQKIPPIPVGDGTVAVEITDEDRKLNINALTCLNDAGNPTFKAVKRLVGDLGLKKEAVNAIADWIDKDDQDRECQDEGDSGAETPVYQGLDDPYEAKNAPFDSLEELRLVNGVDEKTFKLLKDFLTPYGDQNDVKVNVNTASREVLTALGDDDSNRETEANLIVAYRPDNIPFAKPEEVSSFALNNPLSNLPGKLKFQSSTFSIVSSADVNGVKKTIQTVVKRAGSDPAKKTTQIKYWRVR
jgi:general secretion pathway protein K